MIQVPNAGQFDDRFISENFDLAGSTTAAGTPDFGAIFPDVEDASSTSIEYFGGDINGIQVSLGTFAVPPGANGEAQFLGVLFENPIVTDVNLTVGTDALFSFDGSRFQSFGAENLARGIEGSGHPRAGLLSRFAALGPLSYADAEAQRTGR